MATTAQEIAKDMRDYAAKLLAAAKALDGK